MVSEHQFLDFYQYHRWKKWYVERIIWTILLEWVLDVIVIWNHTRGQTAHVRTTACSPTGLPELFFDITFHWEKSCTTMSALYYKCHLLHYSVVLKTVILIPSNITQKTSISNFFRLQCWHITLFLLISWHTVFVSCANDVLKLVMFPWLSGITEPNVLVLAIRYDTYLF